MAITKIQSESLNLADDFAFTGTITGAGGITEADTFRLSSAQSITAGVTTTLTGFSRDNEITFGKIGTGLSESSGVFTFPSTGIYFLNLNVYFYRTGDITYCSQKIVGTTNGVDYNTMTYHDQSMKQVVGNTYHNSYLSAIFDCQNTSTHKVKFQIYGTHDLTVEGQANDGHTYVHAIRLGDT